MRVTACWPAMSATESFSRRTRLGFSCNGLLRVTRLPGMVQVSRLGVEPGADRELRLLGCARRQAGSPRWAGGTVFPGRPLDMLADAATVRRAGSHAHRGTHGPVCWRARDLRGDPAATWLRARHPPRGRRRISPPPQDG